MGLFDIFRRHKKKTEPAEQPTSVEQQSAQTSEAASAQPTAAPSSAPLLQEPTSEQPSVPAQESAPASQDTDEPAAPASVAPQPTEEVSQPTEPASAAPVTEQEAQPTVVSTSEEIDEEPVEQPSASTSEAAADSTESTAPVQDNQPIETADTVPAAEQETQPTTVQEAVAEQPQEQEAEETDQTVKKYDQGLAKSRTGFGARLNRFLANFRHVDEDFFDDLEDMLIESDVGYDMAMKLSDELREEVKLENAKSKQEVSNVIIEKMVDLYDQAGKDENPDLNMAQSGPTVIMFVGVNGAGKTTTIGKMAALFKKQGKKVLLAAADTFRAGATEQLDVWAKRDGVDIVTGPENGDPAAVVFDAVQKAKREDYDILFVDTAGRLQNKVNLMKELAKMKRILTREIPDAPHEVLLVLDATTGQNALNQAKLFKQSTDVTGIVLTKLDGTARGGIVLAIRNELHLPVKYVGLGEKVDDLQKFDAGDFVYGLFKGLVDVD